MCDLVLSSIILMGQIPLVILGCVAIQAIHSLYLWGIIIVDKTYNRKHTFLPP